MRSFEKKKRKVTATKRHSDYTFTLNLARPTVSFGQFKQITPFQTAASNTVYNKKLRLEKMPDVN